jgi:hypothetical protein
MALQQILRRFFIVAEMEHLNPSWLKELPFVFQFSAIATGYDSLIEPISMSELAIWHQVHTHLKTNAGSILPRQRLPWVFILFGILPAR